MTLVAAWVRTVRDCAELIVASDSRLEGGFRWDGCPKIFPLARSDALIAFAGNTQWAYPLMLQLERAIAIYPRSQDRALQLEAAKTYALKVFNDMYREFRRPADPSMRLPGVEFLFGGWSWVHGAFRLWHCTFSNGSKRFEARPAKTWFGTPMVFAGSAAPRAYDQT